MIIEIKWKPNLELYQRLEKKIENSRRQSKKCTQSWYNASLKNYLFNYAILLESFDEGRDGKKPEHFSLWQNTEKLLLFTWSHLKKIN